ncbi:C4-dicarboxylate TRAP transporter substrate-binding protein [Sporosarcina sp. FSL W7-1349]|uniref:C4-dicarboxylate TRAP transporter substrate-binding protein n=1 Tax=Sporosarcina sp. FSL W7-1349 TaxID=2921561 RepID=UPI0030FAC2F4
MKRLKASIASIGLVFALLLTACGSDSVSEANGTATDAAETDNNKTYKFKSSIQAPKEAKLSQGFDAYLDEVEKNSDGRVTFERYYSESLVKAADTSSAVGAGIADIALIVPGYTPANNPLATIESLPALWVDQWTGTRAMQDLYNEFPELKEEYESQGIQVVGNFVLPSYYYISTKDVKSFEDIKGQKVIAAGTQSILAEALDTVSVGIVITESFEAMERGAVDSAMLGFTSSATYGIHELAKSVWKLPLGSQGGVLGMNKDKFDALPDDLKKIFEEAAVKNAVDFHNIYQVEGEESSLQKYLDAGVTINEPSDEDVAKLQEIAKEAVWKKWIDGPERKGKPAEEILDRFVELIEKYDEEYQTNGIPE